MIYLILVVLFWILAAICNAVSDTLDHHYYVSIFHRPENINNARWTNFFNPEKSSISAYILPFTKYKLDAWHLSKSLMIIFFVCSLLCAIKVPNIPILNTGWFLLIMFIGLGLLWNGTFNLFYNHLLKTKKWKI